MKSPERYIEVTFRFWKENDSWVGQCEELDVSSFGKTLEEAREMVADAVIVYLNGLEEFGQRERVLREKGITLKRVPHPKGATSNYMDVGLDEFVQRTRLGVPALT